MSTGFAFELPRHGAEVIKIDAPQKGDNGGLPYGVVSLYDVLKFAAEDFWNASQILTELRENPGLAKGAKATDMLLALNGLIGNVSALDMPVSLREIQKFNLWMNPYVRELLAMPPEKQREEFSKSGPVVRTKIEQVSSVIHSELESRTFFHVQQNHIVYYDQKELFGVQVNAKFTTIQYDMVEAGNCYAMGRGTACVFHLMRIMEVGVQEFGKKLGVQLANEKNWQNILDETNKAIKLLPTKAAGTVEMSQAAANLYCVKLAWRNEVMHPNDVYTPEEAEDLIRQVKLFMGQLAKIV